ncbi:hypothetical protein E4U21_001091 [Claviceps maximensis]|nr:hypothetical protein E4U21_001091 [Claviceps maximensis]
MTPRLIFGAASLGGAPDMWTNSWTTAEQTAQLLQVLKKAGITEIDAGASYPHGKPWHAEALLGAANAVGNGFSIHTKIAAHVEGPKLDHERIAASLDRSRSETGVEKFALVYAHRPDMETPVAVTAAAFHEQYLAGKFEQLGLCNYSVDQIIEYFAVCDANGYVKPSVLQHMYNAIYRTPEETMFPLLQKHNVKSHAFSPLAGGFLSGKVTKARETGDTSLLVNSRWHPDTMHVFYDKMFNKPIFHEALGRFKAACDGVNPPIGTAEAGLRWLLHHSRLAEDDAIIIGASSISQIENSVAWSKKGPLDEPVVSAVEAMWTAVKSAQRDAE